MKTRAVFYHAGCPVCVDAERALIDSLDRARYEVERVHLGNERARIAEARSQGVRSVPALVLEGKTYHINFGAQLDALG
jgi:glutaredoxin